MTKKQGLFLLITCAGMATVAQYKKYTFQQPKMGSPFNILIYSTDSLQAATAANKVFLLIDTLNQIYSDYLPDSELNRLCASSGSGRWISVSEPLFTIMQKSVEAGRASSGNFDVTLSPVIRLWRTARKLQKLPDRDSIKLAMKRVGYRYILIDKLHKKIKLLKLNMQVDLGGIAQGEAAQRAHNRLLALGFGYTLVDAGGDIVAGKTPPTIEGWRVAINTPRSEELMSRPLIMRDKAVTTSGDLYQYLEVNGRRYSHIINPATGWALANGKNVTVIANNGTDADWLTKACSILPVAEAIALIKKFKGVEVQIALLKKGEPVYYRSPGFAKYFR